MQLEAGGNRLGQVAQTVYFMHNGIVCFARFYAGGSNFNGFALGGIDAQGPFGAFFLIGPFAIAGNDMQAVLRRFCRFRNA